VERKWWTLLASCIAIFMLLLDVTIVNVEQLSAGAWPLRGLVSGTAATLAGCGRPYATAAPAGTS
jgi:hypothetical protein